MNYTSEPKWKEMELVVGRSRNKVDKSSPVLTLLSIDEEGRVRRSTSTKLPIKTAPWSVDFALPQSVRVAEELIVDVTLTNHFHANCSQVRTQIHFWRRKGSLTYYYFLIAADSAANGADRRSHFCCQW